MKKKYCTCRKKGLTPDIDEKKKCVRCSKKVYSQLDAYKKVRRSALIDIRTKVKKSDKLYDRKKSKRFIRKGILEEI